MRARDTSAGAPCWIDLNTSDTAVAREFYVGLFGWTAEEPTGEFGGYFMFNHGGVPVAGCMPAMPDGGHDIWSVYLTVQDIEETIESVLAHDGQVVVAPMKVGEAGTMAVALDPGQAPIGLWQPEQFAGTVNTGEPGLPSWFELTAHDYDAQVPFYRDVFGWTTEVVTDTPGQFRYIVLAHGQDRLAGIMDGGPDPFWDVYFWVADSDAALARVTELGGKVLRDAEDTPYGRLATVADPLGARFKLMAANAMMPAAD